MAYKNSKHLLTLLVALYCLGLTAQTEDKRTFNRWHLLRTQGNLSFGYMPALKKPVFYVTGDAEFFISGKTSIYGEASVGILNSLVAPQGFNFSPGAVVLSGGNYHFTPHDSRFDLYAGLNPGVRIIPNITRAETPEGLAYLKDRPTFCPVVGLQAGATYYIGSVFNFFARVQYLHSSLQGFDVYAPQNLNEVRVTAGLGWTWGFLRNKATRAMYKL